MKTAFLIPLMLVGFLALSASASDSFIVVVSTHTDADLSVLKTYSGRAWGRTADKIYLSGGKEEITWLKEYNIEFELIEYDDDRSSLYIWYHVPPDQWPNDMDILDQGEGYILATHPPSGVIEYRRLSLRRLPFAQRESHGNMLLEYNPAVDALIGAVSQDTVIDFLSRLTGASPIEINGGLDTIHTRYSGTPDNELAAQFLKETLEGYGYEAEYHGFYGGSIRHITAYDENLAWLVTEDSEALRTTDGGQNWDSMPDNTNSSLWGIANVGSDLLWLTGDNGTIRFSSDGGESFQSQSSGVSAWLFGVNFVNSSEGWVAGDGGTILHTADGGLEWTTQSTPTGSRLYDICFVDESYGWACGREGTILNTTDGGVTWENQDSQSNQRLYGIDFTDQDNGWAVGWNG
ncbi:MAG: YCF48-related protein, partial [candidate division Zixibacteria bacterium]